MPSRSVNDRPSRSTDHVELFRVHRFHHGVQPGSLLPALGAADPSILVNFHDLPAGAISYRFQFPALIFGVLFGRADANVECKKVPSAVATGHWRRLMGNSTRSPKECDDADQRGR